MEHILDNINAFQDDDSEVDVNIDMEDDDDLEEADDDLEDEEEEDDDDF